MIGAGNLRHRVSLLKSESGIVNELNEVVAMPPTAVKSFFAEVKPLSSAEMQLNAQIQLYVTHQVRIRFTQGINAKDQLDYCGRILNIESIIDVGEKHEELKMLCSEERN